MKTYTPTPRDVERRWYVVDADGAVLGRLASEVAKILRGKHKPIFAPHADTGDHVIVVNARGVRLTGGKEQKKVEYRHSGYPGGLRETLYARLMEERPVHAVEKAIRGMLPKNRLGRAMARKLQVYEGPEHPHEAQKPVRLALGEVPAWEGLPKPEAPRARKTEPKLEAPARRRRPVARKAAEATTTRRPSGRRTAKSTSRAATPKSAAKKATARAGTSRRGSTTKASGRSAEKPARPSRGRKEKE